MILLAHPWAWTARNWQMIRYWTLFKVSLVNQKSQRISRVRPCQKVEPRYLFSKSFFLDLDNLWSGEFRMVRKLSTTFILIFLSGTCWANSSKQQIQFGIIPLDPTSAKQIDASSMKSQRAEFNQAEKEFHAKAYLAYQKISPILKMNQLGYSNFINDCLFMVDEGFYSKYAKLPKNKLDRARRKVLEIFEG
jgi:hypothetical protein